MRLLRFLAVIGVLFSAGSAFAAAASAQRSGSTSTRGGSSSQASRPGSESTKANGDRPDYVLQPHDLIRVEVFQEPDLQKEVRLSQDSVITLPLINSISLKGMTVQTAENLIRTLYARDYLVNPQINVLVIEYAKREVQVLGHVNNPGPVAIPTDRPLPLTAAIAGAGGPDRLARKSQITITRIQSDGTSDTMTVDLDDILESKADDIILQQGDVINVPERIL